MKLTEEQIDMFKSDGFLIVRGALAYSDLQPVIDELSDFIDTISHQLKAMGKIENLYEGAPFEERYGLLFKQYRGIGKGLDIMFLRGRAMFEFLHNDNLLDIVESLVGPGITCNPIQHLRAKPPAAYEENEGVGFHNVSWHQDAGVMMHEAEMSNVITCWLPLGDATEEMGCMQILPGVAKEGYLKHEGEGGPTIWPELLPDVEPLSAICQKGDMVLMNKFTPHSSIPNRTKKCRWSLDLRFQPMGEHTGRTAHPDFVVRCPGNLGCVGADYKTWCRMWIDAIENPRGMMIHRNDRDSSQ